LALVLSVLGVCVGPVRCRFVREPGLANEGSRGSLAVPILPMQSEDAIGWIGWKCINSLKNARVCQRVPGKAEVVWRAS
jgi:hypothetical protein